MGVTLDAISGENLVGLVTDNIPTAFDLSGKGVADFMRGVSDKAAGKKISVLRIWCHGVTHYNDGTQYDKGGNIKLGEEKVGPDTIDKYVPALTIISPLFEPGARVELRGCQAAYEKGKDMMLKMANIWKVEVQGAERSQPMMAWVPPVYSAMPGAKSLKSATIIEYNERPARQ
jgi:hypothetical protein